ncbi:MAG: tetratricopeptide repeat protein, partial [Hormoscilla sp. SP12CHS1]|nr:tetratricopeptide repeat protein [Hormoscilla sp. SP12CHS1]
MKVTSITPTGAVKNLFPGSIWIASFDKAIKIKPDDYEAWYIRGNALEKLSRYDKAFASYDKAIKIKPDYQSAWWRRGYALLQLSRYDEV